MSLEPTPVFFDPSRRRALWLGRAALAFGVALFALVVVFWASVLVVPVARRVRLARPRFLPDNPDRLGNTDRVPWKPRNPSRRHPDAAAAPGRAQGMVGGFFVDWDPASLESLRRHGDRLTHLFPGWLHLDPSGGRLDVSDSDPLDRAALSLARAQRLVVVPVVNNYADAIHDFDERRLHALLTDPARRRAVADSLRDYAIRCGYGGILLDLETEDPADRAALADFCAEVAARLHAHGLLVGACTQAGNPPETGAIAAPCDFVVPMLYDAHWAGGEPGPIAPEGWVRSQIDGLLRAVPAGKIALGVGNYAYDWAGGRPGARTLTFGEAMHTAHESLDGSDGVVRWDRASGNPHFTYEEEGARHQVWLMDGPVAWNLLRYARARGIGGRALWYVGSEDPTLWGFFGRGGDFAAPQALSDIRYGFEIDFEGEGELLDVAALPQTGHRTLSWGSDGRCVDERWDRYPSACVLRRSGRAPGRVALTFDDGPDPVWTPRVLDALRAAGVPATFFVLGSAVQAEPELLRRIWDEGHDVGNHSFYHPNLAAVGDMRAQLEIDATQRAIQSVLNRSTPLFRPPYGVDVQPETAAEAAPIALAQRLGYVTVAESVDPRDWESGSARPDAAQIVSRVVHDVEAGRGGVVLLHDAGGDRSETVRAIPQIVARLRARGYTFVRVSALAGAGDRATFFPPVPAGQRLLIRIDALAFLLSAGLGRLLSALLLFSLAMGALRTAGIALLALLQARRPPPPEPTPPFSVSVTIAAYGEEKVIERTLDALRASDYPDLEIVVVDDGSVDRTAQVVEAIAAVDPRVRLLRQENAGKAAALNRAIAASRGEIVVGIDADTLCAPGAIRSLARHFADPRVGAVAGNIRVGNHVNVWTRLQALEYATSQNFDRRAFTLLNAVSVVPGCIGAWRRAALEAAGGYARDTMAEDADLTWRVRRMGWRIATANDALAFTEAPETRGALLRQRFRWTFGTLQVMWKHRGALGDVRLGWFGTLVTPLLWVFSVVLPALAPVADAGIVAALASGRFAPVAGYLAACLGMEALAAALALSLDGADGARRRDLWLVPLQRTLWRYLLLAVLWRALLTALRGRRAGWGKLERTGTARVAP